MGGSSPTPRDYGPSGVDCEDLDVKTQLSSPVPTILAMLKSGDILDVELRTPTGPCVVTYKGEIAGTIINKDLKKINECIIAGHKFVARVRSVIGARCSITIKHKTAI